MKSEKKNIYVFLYVVLTGKKYFKSFEEHLPFKVIATW